MYANPDAARKLFMQKIMEAQGGGGAEISGLGTPEVTGPGSGYTMSDSPVVGFNPGPRIGVPESQPKMYLDGPGPLSPGQPMNTSNTSPWTRHENPVQPEPPVGIAPDSWKQAGFTPEGQGDLSTGVYQTALEKLLARLQQMGQ